MSGEAARPSRALNLLVLASRVSPPLRAAVQAVEDLIASLQNDLARSERALAEERSDHQNTTSCYMDERVVTATQEDIMRAALAKMREARDAHPMQTSFILRDPIDAIDTWLRSYGRKEVPA